MSNILTHTKCLNLFEMAKSKDKNAILNSLSCKTKKQKARHSMLIRFINNKLK